MSCPSKLEILRGVILPIPQLAGHRQSGTTLELPQKGGTYYFQDRTAACLDNYMKIIQLLQVKCTLQATPLMLNLLLQ